MEQNDLLRILRDDHERLKQTETRETPPLYLPFAQRVLNSFPLASSGATWGEMGQPWPVLVLAFYASVFVSTTNNGTNFWTINLVDSTGGAVASVNTSAIAANTWTRLSDLTITQPASTSPRLVIVPTATLSPGAIFIAPSVALLRTGN